MGCVRSRDARPDPRPTDAKEVGFLFNARVVHVRFRPARGATCLPGLRHRARTPSSEGPQSRPRIPQPPGRACPALAPFLAKRIGNELRVQAERGGVAGTASLLIVDKRAAPQLEPLFAFVVPGTD